MHQKRLGSGLPRMGQLTYRASPTRMLGLQARRPMTLLNVTFVGDKAEVVSPLIVLASLRVDFHRVLRC